MRFLPLNVMTCENGARTSVGNMHDHELQAVAWGGTSAQEQECLIGGGARAGRDGEATLRAESRQDERQTGGGTGGGTVPCVPAPHLGFCRLVATRERATVGGVGRHSGRSLGFSAGGEGGIEFTDQESSSRTTTAAQPSTSHDLNSASIGGTGATPWPPEDFWDLGSSWVRFMLSKYLRSV